MTRAYTVEEIDRMRLMVDALNFSHLYGVTNPDSRARVTEDKLRTYMLANLGPEDLLPEMQKQAAREQAARALWLDYQRSRSA